MGFFQTFITNIQQCKPIYNTKLESGEFRKFLINHYGKNINLIKLFKNSLIHTLDKHQRCLIDEDDYYVANDLKTNTYYICYKNLMMLDIDIKDNYNIKQVIDDIQTKCLENKNLVFDIYQSINGLHIFALHQEYNYTDDSSLEFMLDNYCDFYYVVYASLRGWSVRLNRKKKEPDHLDLYKYYGRIGTGKVNPKLEKLSKIHIKFTYFFKNQNPSLMK